MRNLRVEGSSDIQEIQVLGDWAYLHNYIEMTVSPPDGGKPVRLHTHDPAQGARRAMAACARRQFAGG